MCGVFEDVAEGHSGQGEFVDVESFIFALYEM